jgi:hypothetical protein
VCKASFYITKKFTLIFRKRYVQNEQCDALTEGVKPEIQGEQTCSGEGRMGWPTGTINIIHFILIIFNRLNLLFCTEFLGNISLSLKKY